MLTTPVNAHNTAPPSEARTAVPLSAMTCPDLQRVNFLALHDHPVEDVATGIERRPVAADDDGWFGSEAIDVYAPGQAASAMAAIRRVARGCHSYTDTDPDSTITVTATDPRLGADDGLVLTYTIKLAVDDGPMTMQIAFLRSGDAIITVVDSPRFASPDDVGTILKPAWAAFREH